MQEVLEKIIAKLGIRAEKSEKKEMDAEHFEYAQMYKGERIAFGGAIEIVKQEAEKYNNGWIPCSERLPKKPAVKAEQNYRLPEYIVTIDGGCESTTLEYAGDGEWHDPLTNCKFKVTAWQPLPAPYQPHQREEKE